MSQLSLHSPVGELTVFEEDGAIVAIEWGWGAEQSATPLLEEARRQLFGYFDGERRDFDLPVAPRGTDFQQRVWRALCDIPYGETRSYAQIADTLQSAARAVGQANASNPIPIIVPCHRVLATGGIGGYSGGDGLPTKRLLLDLESRHLSTRAGALL